MSLAPAIGSVVTILSLALLLPLSTIAQVPESNPESKLGWFSDSGDVGAVENKGSVVYNAEEKSYVVAGSGLNMWFGDDQCQFVWRKMKGDFLVRAHAELLGEGVDPHRKLGVMFRKFLDADAPYVDIAVHGDGLTSMQYRLTKGADTLQVESKLMGPDVMQLERKDGKFIMSVAKFGDTFSQEELAGLDLGDEVYVGIFVCSHNKDVVEKGKFSNVRIVVPVPDDYQPYRDYFGSRLEVMDVETGHRKIIHTTEDSMQAPNWTVDGKTLIYNRNGKLYNFDLANSEVSQLNTDFAIKNNNDHVLSFDGKQLAISHHSADHDGKSMIYTMPATGGTPKLVTKLGPSYLHGWSPDGKFLIYTGGRDDKYDIYKIPSDGGDEVQLTKDSGLNDGSEFGPDGKIYFNSTRTGTMELWRMNADGSGQTQLTDDEYNNWFPHVSPDGKTILFISYSKEVEAADHPFYKHVYLRKMPIEGGKPTVVAYLYGGQGTINVPSWSPDGKKVAFVSNSDVSK
ncbi:TolB family protein [Mariniblastus fucicola]|uniref:Translocation protein TolB n=1 Tax=Mariniblastus fucicola TaxID=980251 RepID=A0A5B9PGC0_9BACT|nr:TolB family protein [Mariniblastus fucicola]QEG24649.1 translocation protein TolB [Mariniblastus fucicola]